MLAPTPRPRRLALLALALAHVACWLPFTCAQPASPPRDQAELTPRAWGLLFGLMLGSCAGATFAGLVVRAVLQYAIWARDGRALARKAARRSAGGPPPLPCVPEEGEPLETCLLVHDLAPTSPPISPLQRSASRREGVMAVLLADEPATLLPR